MKRQILIVAGILMGVTTLCGQNVVQYSGANFQFVTGGEGKIFGVESIGSQLVTGKPFSATEERHSIQTLGDGTRIENSETNRLYRDEQGRTRIERKGGNISIFDPVTGISAELDPVAKTVSKTNVLMREGRIVGKLSPAVGNTETLNRLKTLQEQLATMQGQYTDKYSGVVQLKAQIADLQKSIEAPGQTRQFFFSAPVKTGGDGPAAGAQTPAQADLDNVKRLTQAYSYSYSSSTGAGPVVLRVDTGDNGAVESLPAQMVNGALAQGTRTTETIPAGKIGNDRPINVVNERWYSNDLQMLVKSTSSDPRFGETTYQLTGIVQASPDASLFQIPAEYTIRK